MYSKSSTQTFMKMNKGKTTKKNKGKLKRALKAKSQYQSFTKEEIQDAIDRLKRGKAGDSSGVQTEQLKNCSERTKVTIRQVFNKILLQKDCTPKTRRKIRIQVIYKKSDRHDVVYLGLGIYRVQPPDPRWFSPKPQNGGSPDGE